MPAAHGLWRVVAAKGMAVKQDGQVSHGGLYNRVVAEDEVVGVVEKGMCS